MPGVEPVDYHGQRALRLVSGDGSSAVVCEQGAHLVSWRTADGRERLYLSPCARFEPEVALRGGIPVVFPQFGGAGPLPRHGFARTAPWRPGASGRDGVNTWAALSLNANEATRRVWPREFEATLEVRLGASSLELALAVRNAGRDPLSFTCALHTYLAVEAPDSTLVSGLQGREYRDNGGGTAVQVQAEPTLQPHAGIDRVYFDVPAVLSLTEPGSTLTLASKGFPDAVVWNPGPQGCAAVPDLPADGWRHLLCLEAAAVGKPLVLEPGRVWTGAQKIQAL